MSMVVNGDRVFAASPVQPEQRRMPGGQDHLLRSLRGSLIEAVAGRLRPDIWRRVADHWDDPRPPKGFYCCAEVLVNGTRLSHTWLEPFGPAGIQRDGEHRARYELAAGIVDRVEPMIHWRPAQPWEERGYYELEGNSVAEPWRGEITVTAGNSRG
jgi:hypothetical protein